MQLKVKAEDAAPPDLVKKLYKYSGAAETFRRFQNNVVFLATDEDLTGNMIEVAKRYLAIGRIVGDADRMAAFNKEQKDKLKQAYDAAELETRVAITRAYRYMFYPSPDAPMANNSLTRETLPAQDTGEVDKDQSNVIIKMLRLLKRALTADDEELSAFYVKSKGWDENQVSLTTEDLRKAFARKIGLRMLFDIGQLRKTIQNGVKAGVWVYYDLKEEFGYDKDFPPPAWEISENTLLYLPAEASRLGIRIKGKWKPDAPVGPIGGGDFWPPEELCPVCGKPISQCVCGHNGKGKPTHLTGEGAVNQAFQQIIDQCQEHGFTKLSKLTLTVSGFGKSAATDLRAVGLAIPQLNQSHVSLNLELQSTFKENTESFQTSFRGNWDRYKRLKTISDAFAMEADELKQTLNVVFNFDGGLEVDSADFKTLGDVLATLQVGKINLDAIPVSEEAGA